MRIDSAITEFNLKFPGQDSLTQHYEELLTNYLNQTFGFSLTFDDYDSLRSRCQLDSLALAFNRPVQESPELPTNNPINSCTVELFGTALTNAQVVYTAYADSVHKQFRDLYLTKCFNVQPRLKMTADLFEYHYTLYYYDQSGNLVQTVPPEGVKLLTDEQVEAVQSYRQRKSESCFQNSDSIYFNNNGYGEFQSKWLSGTPFSLEATVNLSNYNDQTIASHLYEIYYGFPVNPFQYYGYAISIDSGKLKLTMNVPGYEYDTESAQLVGKYGGNMARTATDLSQLIPLSQWKKIYVSYADNHWRLFINGASVPLVVISDMEAPVIANTFMAGGAPEHYPSAANFQGSIKNVRVYSRELGYDELAQNVFSNCGQPVSQDGLVMWAPLTAADDNILLDLVGASGTLNGVEWTPDPGIHPDHFMITTYSYNSLNQVRHQATADAGPSQFFYDRLGRLIASENAKQSFRSREDHGGYSITEYDSLGRITQVAEKKYGDDILVDSLLSNYYVQGWMQSGERSEVTTTIYDQPMLPGQSYGASRQRVTASLYQADLYTGGDTTFYAYDISGNVKTLVQYIKGLADLDPANGYKSIGYDYDLVSGKVNQVKYQEGKGDQFFHKYRYDADNRITQVLTSRDQLVWTEDASYRYYLHGPLARTELGQLKVQGIDYAYTLQGWLKAINGDALNPETEIGQDGKPGSLFARVSRDAYAFSLGYYHNDYLPVGGSGAGAASQDVYTAPASLASTGNQLFNGNISYTTLALSKFDTASIKGYTYGYDQLNRLVEMRQHDLTGAWSNSSIIDAYRESIAYDANGNIEKYLRKGANQSGMPLDMDSLTYRYAVSDDGRKYGNQLQYVSDAVGRSNYAVDIDDQQFGNYQYDVLGNLTADASEHLNIEWNLYGKIRHIQKQVDDTSSTTIDYGYDAGGNRTWKKVGKYVWADSHEDNTFYVRDAQGNVMATYTKKDSDATLWADLSLYGSSRLGLLNISDTIPSTPPIVIDNTPMQDSLTLGSRTYELKNHLGNVLVTLSDKKVGVPSVSDSSLIAYYQVEPLSGQDYYPGGMQMPGRSYSAGNYAYGYQGSEKNKELNTDTYTTFFRELDTRIGRWGSIDPKTNASQSPYVIMNNNPVWYNDVLGNSVEPVVDKKNKTISMNANIYLSGKVSQKQMNKIWQMATKAFNEQLNSKTFKAQYNGEEYTVTFNVKIFTISEADADKMASENKSTANNFITVFDNQRSSYSSIGKNVAAWTTGDFFGKAANPTTVVHEFFHSLGLTHPKYEKYLWNSGFTTNPATGLTTIGTPSFTGYHPAPRIIDPRGEYYYAGPSNYVELHAQPVLKRITGFERGVQQEDINEAVKMIKTYKVYNATIKTYDSNASFLR